MGFVKALWIWDTPELVAVVIAHSEREARNYLRQCASNQDPNWPSERPTKVIDLGPPTPAAQVSLLVAGKDGFEHHFIDPDKVYYPNASLHEVNTTTRQYFRGEAPVQISDR